MRASAPCWPRPTWASRTCVTTRAITAAYATRSRFRSTSMPTLAQAEGPKARSLSELEAAGVCSATFPSIALFAAVHAVRNVVRQLKRSDTLAPCQEHLVSLDDYYNLVGLKDLLAREESYDK